MARITLSCLTSCGFLVGCPKISLVWDHHQPSELWCRPARHLCSRKKVCVKKKIVMLHPSCNIHKHVSPLLCRSRPGSRPIQTATTTSSDPDHIKTCDCLVSFLASNSWFTIHQLWNSCQRYHECLQSSWIRSVNTIARPLRLSVWPLAKPQTHVEIWCHIMTTWSSSWGLGNLGIMPLYVTPSFQTSGSPRDDPDGF